jgi:hypothetical protein
LEKGDGRRLVEYLVVVTSILRKPEESSEENPGQEYNLSTSFDDEDVIVEYGFKPQITARYPLHDHEDNPLHENVTFFCHPSGAIHLKKDDHMPKVRGCWFGADSDGTCTVVYSMVLLTYTHLLYCFVSMGYR